MIPLLMIMMMIWGTMTLTGPSRPSFFFFWGGGGGVRASSKHETVFTKYVPSEGPFFPIVG